MAPLCFGDRVLIRSPSAGSYLCADGIFDVRVRLHQNPTAQDGDWPKDVEGCLFELRPSRLDELEHGVLPVPE